MSSAQLPGRPSPAPGGGRPGAVVPIGALLAILGLVLGLDALTVAVRGAAASAVGRVSALGTLPAPGVPVRPAKPGPAPTTVTIPSIDVRSALVHLHLDKTGALQVPTDFTHAGWWTGGPRPGDVGTAVIVGHVDSYDGAAVFFRLRELVPGATVSVARADGSAAVFVVDARREYPKKHFPSPVVYGPTGGAALRLITCGGSFDERRRSYTDNVVVFAHLRAIVPALRPKHPHTKPHPKPHPTPYPRAAPPRKATPS